MIASIIGFIGVAALIGLAVLQQNLMLGGICVLIVMNCWGGLTQARALARVAAAPRHDGFACPICKVAPPSGAFWICGKCRKPFDMFETHAFCPNCGAEYGVMYCPECGSLRPMSEWASSSNVPPKL